MLNVSNHDCNDTATPWKAKEYFAGSEFLLSFLGKEADKRWQLGLHEDCLVLAVNKGSLRPFRKNRIFLDSTFLCDRL